MAALGDVASYFVRLAKTQASPAQEKALKISVCGKGGSGKSTIVALLSAEFRRGGKRVVVIDSDESNSGLHAMLGLDEPPKPLMELAGGRKNVRRALGTVPAAGGEAQEKSILASDAIRLDDLPADYVRGREGMRLIVIGKIHRALEGCACPTGVLSREFLKRLVLAEDEIAVIDMEAGIEHFGRGVETSIDAVLAVAEPSLESVNLAEKVGQLASTSGSRFAGAVLNKIDSRKTEERLVSMLRGRGVPLVGIVRSHPELAEAGLEGRALPARVAEEEVRPIADAVLGAVSPAGHPGQTG